jgi:hypothetical protein
VENSSWGEQLFFDLGVFGFLIFPQDAARNFELSSFHLPVTRPFLTTKNLKHVFTGKARAYHVRHRDHCFGNTEFYYA